MVSRTSSSNLVVATSFFALAIFMWGILLDWHFVITDWVATTGQFGFTALVYVAFICGWIWALIAVRGGSRRARYVLLGYALLLCAYALQDLIIYCPSTCPRIWLYYIANWGNLALGLASGVAIVLRMRSASSS